MVVRGWGIRDMMGLLIPGKWMSGGRNRQLMMFSIVMPCNLLETESGIRQQYQ